jgi:DNA-binding LacI/PurR family transcriptional regulator
MEDDLFELLEQMQGLKVGKDIGIISYNETKAKKYIMNGLTTISTDFEAMGRRAAELVLKHSKQQWQNPFHVTLRDSL